MTEENIVTRNIGVTFEHKISDGNYGGSTASAWVADTVPEDAAPADVAEALNELFNAAKASVFDHLGLEFLVDESGVIRAKHAPVASVESRLGSELGARPVSGGNTGGLKVMNAADQQGDLPAGLIAFCAAKGVTAVWDNRKSKGRHFAEAVAKGGTSVLDPGASKGVAITPDMWAAYE